MPFRERLYFQRSTIDGDSELITSLEYYRQDAALFLLFDPVERSFLFERRLQSNDPLKGQIVIPGEKKRDLGERIYPLWAVERGLMEEYGIVARTMVYLGEVVDKQRGILLSSFLAMGILWGEFENKEPEKRENIWLRWSNVFLQNGQPNPIFSLNTTREVLVRAKEEIRRYNL